MLTIIAINPPPACPHLKLYMADNIDPRFVVRKLGTRIFGPDMIQQTTDKIKLIKERMRASQNRQKAYADKCHKPLKFEVRDKVFLKVSPTKGVICTSKRNKLDPKYVRPFEILDKIESVAYRLAFPPDMERIHNIFHISQLRKYIIGPNPNHIISTSTNKRRHVVHIKVNTNLRLQGETPEKQNYSLG